ncbi:hypothetical protein [Streptomyces sp. YIM S03343]
MSSPRFTFRSALCGAGFASLTAAAVTLTPEAAVAAPAAEAPGVFVTPVSPAPGSDIVLAVSGCAERTATATSDAFVTDARLAGADGTLVGESRVRSSARPGKYTVQVVCGVVRIKGTLTVAAPAAFQASVSSASTASTASAASAASAASKASAPATTSTAPTVSSPATASTEPAPATPAAPLTPASPVAPVPAGGGGTAGLVAVDAVAAVDDTDGSRASGPDAAQSATGLVLASAAAVAVALRGSRRRRDSD